MGLFLRILLGLGIVVVGAFFVIKTRKILDFFGPISWAEQHLGGGGSALLYKVIGLLFCFVGFMVATDLWNAFLQATLGSFLPHNAQL
jgi:hypothetical protein